MGNLATPILKKSVIATAVLTPDRFCTVAGALPADGGNGYGVAQSDAAIGDRVTLDVLGTTIAEVSAAVTAGDALELGVDGRVETQSAGVTVARALESATAAGQKIEILLIAN